MGVERGIMCGKVRLNGDRLAGLSECQRMGGYTIRRGVEQDGIWGEQQNGWRGVDERQNL